MLDSVERIEVLKGPASSIYGASAMGGVVNVITRRSRGPVTGGVRLGFGRYNTSDLGSHAGSTGSRGISTSAAWRSTSATTSGWATGW